MRRWKDALAASIAPPLGREIDIFETEILLRKQGKIDEKLFAETRLRRGAYGQRYDNGQRHDGFASRSLPFPSGSLTKGPGTLWDAPGMQRIKIPFGRLTAAQMEALAEVADEYSDGILHVTTRQDFQLHFVHLDDTPDLMRRLAAVGITTREACGNTIRNVTACPNSGVCAGEPFDVSPYAHAAAWFLLGHPETQDFGRKFKIAFSGCQSEGCGLVMLHDLGAIARTRTVDGRLEQGFALYVGGGLGSVPHQAKLLDEFVPATELLPIILAVARLFTRLGEKKNRARARLKFVVARLGIDELRRLVHEERGRLTDDPRWRTLVESRSGGVDGPLLPGAPLGDGPHDEGFARWFEDSCRPQRQAGYVVATVRLPLGDLTADQLRRLADLARRFTGDTVCNTVEQNIAFRWLPAAQAPAFHAALQQIGLASPGAGTIADVVACPGTDTCKLGISSSRGLAAELEERYAHRPLPAEVRALHVKTSGCFNACGQHHIADLGFLGVSRTVGGRRVPHFQVVLGGQWQNNAGAYGLAIGAVPSKRVPEVIERLGERFLRERLGDESFQTFIARIGKGAIRQGLADLLEVPPYEVEPSFYSDWGDPREYTIGDLGTGECAGEVVPLVQFGLAASEREAFEAQLALDRGEAAAAGSVAYRAMLTAAKALLGHLAVEVADEGAAIVGEFRARLVEPGLFADPFAGDKFAQYLFRLHERGGAGAQAEEAHQWIEEALLFIEAAHGCYDRLTQARLALVTP